MDLRAFTHILHPFLISFCDLTAHIPKIFGSGPGWPSVDTEEQHSSDPPSTHYRMKEETSWGNTENFLPRDQARSMKDFLTLTRCPLPASGLISLGNFLHSYRSGAPLPPHLSFLMVFPNYQGNWPRNCGDRHHCQLPGYPLEIGNDSFYITWR